MAAGRQRTCAFGARPQRPGARQVTGGAAPGGNSGGDGGGPAGEVVTDETGREAIGIRDMIYLALSFDHRLVDGATADQFMAALKAALEACAFELG